MAPLKCCVGGCNSTSDSHRLFSVPKDDDLRKLWMSFLVPTNALLIGLTKEQLIRKRVCEKHFDKYQMHRDGRRRTRFSYPCLFSETEIAHGVPLSSEEYHVLTEHKYHKEEPEENADDDNAAILVIGKEDDEHSYPSCSSAEVVTKSHTPALKNEATTRMDEIPSRSYGEQYRKKASPIPLQTQKDDELSYPSCSSAEVVTKSYTPALKSEATSRMDEIPSRYDAQYRRKASLLPLQTQKGKSQKRKYIKEARKIATESLGKSSLQRLNEAQKLSQSPEFFKNFDLLNKQAKTFLSMQLKLVKSNKMARRFNMDEKLVALTIFKQSPKGYKLLEKMFALPSKRTLIRLSEKICFEPGINTKVFKYVQEATKYWDRNKKLCTITFDEVALSPHLTFNKSKDIIDGFVELGGDRKLKYCDHALVFMIRGICSPWRQSLAYYFCEGTVSAAELVQILKKIVFQVAQSGLIPLGLVCDQGSTFRTALKTIRQDTIRSRETQKIRDDGTIEVSGLNLNIFYDPPHLLKSIRNNFITKDILFDGKIGSWKDIMFIFDIDNKLGHTRTMPKLTAHHVIPKKIKKMKVSVATQVLSARTAAMLKFTCALNNIHKSQDSAETTMSTTAEIVEFFDNLFDSVNGSPGCAQRGKLRSAVKENSPHFNFWQEAIRKLKQLQFRDNISKRAIHTAKSRFVRVPCLEGWITTLESFIRLSNLLFSEYGVEYYYPRFVNQDPLENFFGRIRAINYRNVNPDAHTFIYSFKALVLSNLLSPHSRFSNCEEDDGETLIDLNFLFEDESTNKENASQITTFVPSSSSQGSDQELATQVVMEKIRVQCSAYTAGYICRRISKFKNCKACADTYITKDIESIHKFIQFREYKTLKRNNLAYPNGNFLRLYREAAQCIHTYLNMHCHKKNVGKNIRSIIKKTMQLSWLGCRKHHHDIVDFFLSLIIRMHVCNWCKIINRILKGDIEEKYVLKMNEAQKLAYKKYEKNRLRKKFVNKIKKLNV